MNPQYGRILLLLTIKEKRKFLTLETAPKLYFCQNKNVSKLNEHFFLLNFNEVFSLDAKFSVLFQSIPSIKLPAFRFC